MSQTIPWPSPGEYSAAIQNPQNCFGDPLLKRGTPETNKLGLPVGASGQFAVVYAVKTAASRYAVRCFIRPVVDQQERYERLSNHLETFGIPALVDFTYLTSGIRVKGNFYPVVRMAWVAGLQLSSFVENHRGDAATLLSLAKGWRGIVAALSGAHTAHGDLQHGNILVDEHNAIKLVDYDGFYIPKLHGHPPGEVGHANYQHPERILHGHYEETSDAFSALVIYLSLLAVGNDPRLWRFHTGENLIFVSEDFKNPGQTEIWASLRKTSNPDIKRLSGELEEHCRNPVSTVPDLESVIQCVGPRMRAHTQPPPSPRPPTPSQSEGRRAPVIVKFKNGQAASVAELVDLCDRCWDEATDYLFNGWLSDRLAEVGEAPLAQHARKVISSFAKHRRRGLEMFVREACRAIGRSPLPDLIAQPASLDAGNLPVGTQKQYRLSLSNQSRGYAWGRIEMQPPLQWVVFSTEFEGSSAHIDLQLDLSNVAPGVYKSQLVIQPEGVPTKLLVALRVEVTALAVQIEPKILDLGSLAYRAKARGQVRMICKTAGGRLLGEASISPLMTGVACVSKSDGSGLDVSVSIDSEAMETGKTHSATLLFSTNAGVFKVPVHFSTTIAWKTVWAWAVGCAAAAGAVMAGLRATVASTIPEPDVWVLVYRSDTNFMVLSGLLSAVIVGGIAYPIYSRRRRRK